MCYNTGTALIFFKYYNMIVLTPQMYALAYLISSLYYLDTTNCQIKRGRSFFLSQAASIFVCQVIFVGSRMRPFC